MGISEATFFLDPEFDGTLQQQLQQLVIGGILAGRYNPGDKMPSSRKLASHLGISRITVTLAYTDLVANDYLTSRGRSGYFVSETAPPPLGAGPLPDPGTGNVDWQTRVGTTQPDELALNRPVNWRRYRYPFIYGQADPTLFDHQNWRQCALQALGQRDFEALTSDYYDADDPLLMDFILRHILPRRGIGARPEEVLLTLGAQNALWLAAEILLDPNKSATIENPCYPGVRQVVQRRKCRLKGIDVDEKGIRPDQISSDTDVVFTTPSHHAPTNATLSQDRRRLLLDQATRDDFLVIEDDYEFELSFQSPPQPALKSLDRQGRVIYIGSFSKSLFPGMRLGYLVGPKPFIDRARALRALVLRHPPGHIQRTLAYFLSRGHYDTQINRMGHVYQTRRAALERALVEHGIAAGGSGFFGGSSIWLSAPNGVHTGKLAEHLRTQSVLIEPGRPFFAPEDNNNTFYRLAYSSIPARMIDGGIARIAETLENWS